MLLGIDFASFIGARLGATPVTSGHAAFGDTEKRRHREIETVL